MERAQFVFFGKPPRLIVPEDLLICVVYLAQNTTSRNSTAVLSLAISFVRRSSQIFKRLYKVGRTEKRKQIETAAPYHWIRNSIQQSHLSHQSQHFPVKVRYSCFTWQIFQRREHFGANFGVREVWETLRLMRDMDKFDFYDFDIGFSRTIPVSQR